MVFRMSMDHENKLLNVGCAFQSTFLQGSSSMEKTMGKRENHSNPLLLYGCLQII